MKLSKIFLLIFIFSSIFIKDSFSKNLPPGTGIGDVPANLLILLDKSGSMGTTMTTGTSIYYPEGVGADSSGDVYGMQYATRGIKKIDYTTNVLDTSFSNNGTYTGTSPCDMYYPTSIDSNGDILYVASYYLGQIFAIDTTTGNCLWNEPTNYPYKLAIKNNILYAVASSTIFVRNLVTNTNISCSYGGDLYARGYNAQAIDVDHDGSNLYIRSSNGYFYRFEIDQSTKCPNLNASSFFLDTVDSYTYGFATHPTDSKTLYYSSYYNHKVCKVTLNNLLNAISAQTCVGSFGTSTSTAANIKFYNGGGLNLDENNNRILVSSPNKSTIQIFDLNLGFLKEVGGQGISRMKGAQDAINSIVTDATLINGVNFGFGYWSDTNGGFSSWSGDISTGTANPCSNYSCLKVRVHDDGAQRISQIIYNITPGGGTNAYDFANTASQYYLHNTFSPVDVNATCQNSYILIIGDGDWYNHASAKAAIENLNNQYNIKTFTVAYGPGISSSGLSNFKDMAVAGGTNDTLIADTPESLKSQLKSAITQIVAQKLSFTAPAISASITEGGSLFQAQFEYEQNKEWTGTIRRTAIDSNGTLDPNDLDNWSAEDQLPTTNSRKIWTVLPGVDYKTDYNNFVDTNSTNIKPFFELYGNKVLDYHSDTSSIVGTTRCSAITGVEDGTDDDTKGLINFIRGEDYFDYDADCDLGEDKTRRFGDIYHSDMVVVGPPNANTSFVNTNQESYWRSIKGYDAWAQSNSTRKEVIYVGSNSGLLHAIDSETGVEKWAFMPPFIIPNFPLIMNTNLNTTTAGGSNAIFGVDGSPVVHDMYFQSALDNAKKWHTILMVPYGRGGAGFSVLDITDPDSPLHLYSVYNDKNQNKVRVVTHDNIYQQYDYIETNYPISSLTEAINVTDNYNANNAVSSTCNSTLTTSCYLNNTWTLPIRGVTQNDLKVTLNGQDYTNFSVSQNTNGDTQITFGTNLQFQANPTASDLSSQLTVNIKQTSSAVGVKLQTEYDYSQMGETWSSPRIFRMPNDGAGDTNLEDDIYVAAMGGGYGSNIEGLGSNIMIINLEDIFFPGKLEKKVIINDIAQSDIVNSIPGSPVVITSDTASGANYRGALLYTNDLEGKITKINLTNMSSDNSGNNIAQYDQTTLFWSGSAKSNGRYMFHSMDAGIGKTTNTMWLFAGTGNYLRVADKSSGTDNLMLGIKDIDFPYYKDVNDPTSANDLTSCSNTTVDIDGSSCPKNADLGWYITLTDYKKVTAEPTVFGGFVYYPIYKPSTSANICDLGTAFICAVDDECGTNTSSLLGTNANSDECFYVGQGVVSKIVTFANKLFANISGKSAGQVDDLVKVESVAGDTVGYRRSWSENF